MKRLLFVFLVIIYHNSGFAQMPTNGDFSKWNWEDTSSDNWKRLKDGKWQTVLSPFSPFGDKMNLIYDINQNKDYTYKKGWRLIHANFMGTFPYFILYNINNGVLRGFAYTEGDAGLPYGNSIIMSLTPDNNLKTTKLLHLSESLQYAINDKSADAKFSQNSITAVTTGGLNSWVALEIPLLFDNTIANINATWTIEFFSGTNSNLTFNINGTSVPMDANGNSLFAHPESLSNNLSLKGEYAKIHSNIKGVSEWGDKLKSHAEKLELNDKSPNFLKTYKDLTGKLGTTIKIAGAITQVSAGLEVALGIFDFFFGGSSSSSPLGYSHNFTGTGQITTLKYLRGHKMSVPGSQNANVPSWSYNCPLGVVNLSNTPSVKKTKTYICYPNLKKNKFGNGYYVSKDKFGREALYISERPFGASIINGTQSYICSPLLIKCRLVQYKLYDNIDLNIKSDVNIQEVKYALISKENDESRIMTKSYTSIYRYEKKTGFLGMATSIYPITPNPIYNNLESGKYTLHEFDRSTKSFIYGTPYMSIADLRNVNFETLEGANLHLGVMIKYTVNGDNEPRYFKGTYKINIAEENLAKTIYIADEKVNLNFLNNSYPASTKFNYFGCNTHLTNNTRNLTISDELELNNVAVQIYPNPSNGILNCSILEPNDNYSVEIYSLSGKRIYSDNKLLDGATIDLSSEQKGIYLVKIISSKKVRTEKIILK